VLALWLTRLCVKVRIIDRTAEPGTTSRAMAVHARTLEFYRQLGLADSTVEAGIKIAGVNLWGRGKKAVRLPIGEIGLGLSPFPFVLDFPQDQHERLLIDQLASLGVQVERQTELTHFDPEEEAIRATLQRPDNRQETCTATYLAGCDGAHSTVRTGLGIGLPGGTYQGLFYVADVEAAGPAIDYEIHVDLDDGDFVGIFPMKAEGRVRLIGAVRELPRGDATALTFEDIRGRAIEHMRLTINAVHWFSTYHVHHRVADHFRGGRAFLLGDAAHVHSPVGGQGMNTGIGDAVNLAWKLAAVLQGRAQESLLDSYEPERITFAQRLVATTDRVFTLVTATGGFAEFIRLKLLPRLVPRLLGSSAARRFLFRTVSQTGIKYRNSPLSVGAAGQVHAGDRLPWVPDASPTVDNFVPLDALAWQVHVYGQPAAGMSGACASLAIPLHAFAWTSRMKQAGLERDAVYLIRPDGYVALAAPDGDPERLVRYFEQQGLRARS
jgi:2-polyprenyl-6-methoxyphenol hydroxylase-like FAD-dependent oxidoreductase